MTTHIHHHSIPLPASHTGHHQQQQLLMHTSMTPCLLLLLLLLFACCLPRQIAWKNLGWDSAFGQPCRVY
jgi:hypothetical protein